MKVLLIWTFAGSSGVAAMKAITGVFTVLLALGAACPTSASEPESRKLESNIAAAAPLAGVVVNEKGAPIAAADVVYSWWIKGTNQTILSKSDEQGRFTLQPPQAEASAAWPPGEIWAGIVGRRLMHEPLFQEGKTSEKNLRLVLPPPANVAITVVTADGKPVAGAVVSVPVAYHEEGSRIVPKPLLACTEATTNRGGVATIAAFDRTELSEVRASTAEHGSQSRYLARQTPEETQSLRIALRPAGRVRGQLVAPDAEIVDGLGVSLMSYSSGKAQEAEQTIGWATAVSDKEGRFEIPALAEGVIRYISVEGKPGQPFLPVVPDEIPLVAGQTVEIDIPFKRAVHVRGIVREKATGRPMVGAVLGLVRDRAQQMGAARTDAEGRFEFWELPGSGYVYLSSLTSDGIPGWYTERRFQAIGGVGDLELPPIELTLARGRVADDAGHGLAGAKIEKVDVEGESIESPVRWSSGIRSLSTDAGGNYQAWVEAAVYRVQVEVDGHAPQWTEWTDFGRDTPPVFPDVVIKALRSIAGRVVDHQRQPVAGARVIQSGDGPQRTEAATDKDGRFRLAGYQNEAGFVFAEKDGFRFHGQPLKAGDDVQIVLTRTSEPPKRHLVTLPETDAAGNAALATGVLLSALDRPLKENDDRDRWTVLQELVEVDPAAALDRLEALGLEGERAEILRVMVAKRWSAEHPDDATAIIEALDDAYSRAVGYVLSAEAMPASLRERKIEWLGKGRFHLRGATDPVTRTALTAYIARLLWESGDVDPSRQLVAEIKPEVEKLPFDGFAAYVRGVTAEALAPFDAPAALALIKGLKVDREYDRHHGNLARILAVIHPADAVRVLKLVRDDFQRQQYAVHVAYRLASVEPAQAQEAIDLIASLDFKALAQGLMAQALSKSDAPAAAAQLAGAYQTLAKMADGETSHLAGTLAAWMVPIVEQVEADRVEEFVWRAVSLRQPLAMQDDGDGWSLRSRAYLAMFLSRYDRDLARDLYGNLAAELIQKRNAGETKYLYAAAAMIDSARAVGLYEKLPDDAPQKTKAQARRGLIDVLSHRGEARWQAVSDYLLLPMPWRGIE
jgi:hypothetical protein